MRTRPSSILKVVLPIFLLFGLAWAGRETYFSDFPATYYGDLDLVPNNDQCRDRIHTQIGTTQVITPYDVEYASPKVLPCANETVTNGVWYSVKGDGTDFHVWACLQNASSDLYYTPSIDAYTDHTCEAGYPCGAQCTALECVDVNKTIETYEDGTCTTLTFRTRKHQEYIFYLYFLNATAPLDAPLSEQEMRMPSFLLPKTRSDKTLAPITLRVDGFGCDGSINEGIAWDDCGVCDGNNTQCRGCDGLLWSGEEFDLCGVCGGDNSTCIGGCDRQPRSNKWFDVCGVCGGDGSSCAGCDGVPEPDPLYRKVFDQCGVCGGDGMSCADCNGVIGGSAFPDPCGVCFGDGSSCADCSGKPNGNAVVDVCGVCGGKNECVGCDGLIFGAQYDVCGVCGGNGTSCLGCNGIPWAVEDVCGVCMGDNSSCTCQFYEEFSRAEMDCQLLEFTINNTLEYIDYLTDVLESTLYEIRNKVKRGALNTIVREEILDANSFEEGCIDGWAMDIDELVAKLQVLEEDMHSLKVYEELKLLQGGKEIPPEQAEIQNERYHKIIEGIKHTTN